jgi:glucose-6-phosphate 1-epimerase
MNESALNARFGLGDRLSFVAGPSGLPHAVITAGGAEAEIALSGAQALRFRHAGEPPILWVSREASYAPGRPVRGGVPICWPWFGPHPSEPSKPAHGFARNQLWEVLASGESAAGLFIQLGLSDSPATQALWPHRFRLDLMVTVGASLDLTLTAHNPGPAAYRFGGALHSYFTVGDVAQIQIHGLDGVSYLDQLSGATHTQSGPVTIGAEVDRVYRETTAACVIEDLALGRRISVDKAGSRSTVVWNPWAEKARRLADLGDDEYPQFVCVETALAHDDSVELAAGASHSLRAIISAAAG